MSHTTVFPRDCWESDMMNGPWANYDVTGYAMSLMTVTVLVCGYLHEDVDLKKLDFKPERDDSDIIQDSIRGLCNKP